MRIAIVQYGDFREGYQRLAGGGPETFYAQKYSVDVVKDLSQRAEFVGVCALMGDQPFDTALTDTLHASCVPRINGKHVNTKALVVQLEKWRPTHLILQTPIHGILRWALSNGVHVLPLLADSWINLSPLNRIRSWRLARALNDIRIPMVANHNVPASLSLSSIGVQAEKIFPWDWPHDIRPENFQPKRLRNNKASLVFAGQIIWQKGVGDCIQAAKLLADEGVDFEMTLAGRGGDLDAVRQQVEDLGLKDRVCVAGPQPHEKILEMFRKATVALAPSWREYPEGLPMTTYEALATRTPLIVSDHPMLSYFFNDTQSVKVVRERNPHALSEAIKSFLAEPASYNVASLQTEALWNRIKCDLSWGSLINLWLECPIEAPDKLARHSLQQVTSTAPNTHHSLRQPVGIDRPSKPDSNISFEQIAGELSHYCDREVFPEEISQIQTDVSKSIVADSTSKFRVPWRSRQAGFLIVSSDGNPRLVQRSVEKIEAIRRTLSTKIAEPVLAPVAQGAIDGFSYAIWPAHQPLCENRLLYQIQKRLLAPKLYTWLRAVAEQTKCQAIVDGAVPADIFRQLEFVESYAPFSSSMRQAAHAALDKSKNSTWSPAYCLQHSDFWHGNILLPKMVQHAPAAFTDFYVIDWGGSNLKGLPFFDVIKIAMCLKTPRRLVDQEIIAHCRIFECTRADATSYVLCALGAIGLEREHFPEDRYIAMSRDMFKFVHQN